MASNFPHLDDMTSSQLEEYLHHSDDITIPEAQYINKLLKKLRDGS